MSDEDIKQIHGEVVGEESRADDIPPTYFVSQDPDLIRDIDQDPDLKPIKCLFSPLTRLTKLDTKEKQGWQIGVNLLMGNMILHMDREEYNSGKWRKIEATGQFLRTVINDSHKGFKMTLLSRLRKEIILSREKKRGLRERLTGGG